MNAQDKLSYRTKGIAGRRPAGWLACVAILMGGCEEYRISQGQFMAMQEQNAKQAEGVAATQPAALTPEEQSIIAQQLGPSRVGPGDVLSVEIIGPEQAAARGAGVGVGIVGMGNGGGLAGIPARVDRKGEIRLPQVGTIPVAGLELEDIEVRILDELIKHQVYTDPQQIVVTVSVASPYTTNVLVQGAAVTPGVVRLQRSERNLLYAVTQAGGVTQMASGEVSVRRLRRPGEEVTLNLFDTEQLKTALVMAPLESGDIVEIKAAQPNTVFVGGLVNMAGPQPYPAGTHVTVLQALAGASGLRTDVTPREATLIRRHNGQDMHVKLNLDRIGRGQDANLTLAAGDVLWVPFTLETRVQDWVNKNLFFRAGMSATANVDYQMPGINPLNKAARSQSGSTGGGLQDMFDPFGFLLRNQALQTLQAR